MAKLGQHFLKNKKILQRIAEALELKNNDIVIEIGPGHGELTDEIINASLRRLPSVCHCEERGDEAISSIKVIAIEKDKKLAAALKEKYKNNKNIEIIEGDALKVLNCHPCVFCHPRESFCHPRESGDPGNCRRDAGFPPLRENNDIKIVGNIPYYITGKLLRILSELENKPQKIILLAQKEVAQRICAPKYNQKMNLLALATQFYADVKILFYVSAGNFVPLPKVDSAVIEIAPRLSSQQKLLSSPRKRGSRFLSSPRKLLSSPRKRGSSAVVFDSRFHGNDRVLDSRFRGNDRENGNNRENGNDSENFFKIIHCGFAKKRKFLISNLSIGLKIPKKKLEEIFEKIGLDFKSRAENLSLEDWKSLTRELWPL